MRMTLPDLFDPGLGEEHDLDVPTPFPLYHIEGTGSFAAIEGEVTHTTAGASHLAGRRVREVLREAWDLEVEVLAVEPRTREWKRWAPRD